MPGVRANAGYSSVTPSRARREAAGVSAKLVAEPIRHPIEIPGANIRLAADKSFVPATGRGHMFSYIALFAFTVVLYARPSELYESPVTASMALVIGIVTLVFF